MVWIEPTERKPRRGVERPTHEVVVEWRQRREQEWWFGGCVVLEAGRKEKEGKKHELCVVSWTNEHFKIKTEIGGKERTLTKLAFMAAAL